MDEIVLQEVTSRILHRGCPSTATIMSSSCQCGHAFTSDVDVTLQRVGEMPLPSWEHIGLWTKSRAAGTARMLREPRVKGTSCCRSNFLCYTSHLVLLGWKNRKCLTVDRISDAGNSVWRILLRKSLWRPLERRDVLMTA